MASWMTSEYSSAQNQLLAEANMCHHGCADTSIEHSYKIVTLSCSEGKDFLVQVRAATG